MINLYKSKWFVFMNRNNKLAAHKLAFEYLRKIPEQFSPADYIKKFEQLESEFRTLICSSNNHSKFTICQLLSRLCAKKPK